MDNKDSEVRIIMNAEIISVVVPVYNVEKELPRCVESLLKQDYDSLEIILVDDGSPDRSGAIADEFAEKYPARVKVIHQNNQGLSGARNAGIDVATGKYLSFIDSDDYVEVNLYSTMVKALEETTADIAVCGRFDEFVDQTKVNFTMEAITTFTSVEAIKRILTWDKIDIAAWDKLYKAELWDNIRFPVGKNNEDICTLPKVFGRAKSVVHVAVPLYHYCHRENSITSTYNKKKIEDFFHAIQQMEYHISNEYSEIQDELVFYLNRSYFSLVLMCEQIRYHGREKADALTYLKKNWKSKYSLSKMTKREKLIYFLIRCRLYYGLRQIRNCVRRRK